MSASKLVFKVFISLVFIAGGLVGCSTSPVAREYGQEHYPPPRNELPRIIEGEKAAYKEGYSSYGSIDVKGSQDVALEQAAKRGAEAVVLKSKTIEEWSTTYHYSHSVEAGKYRTDVYQPGSKQDLTEGYEVYLYKYNPQKAAQHGLDKCYFGYSQSYRSKSWTIYSCNTEDIQYFIDKGADITQSPIAGEFAWYISSDDYDWVGLVCEGMPIFRFIVGKNGIETSHKYGRETIEKVKGNIKNKINQIRSKSPDARAIAISCDKAYLNKNWYDKAQAKNQPMWKRPLSPGEQIWYYNELMKLLKGKSGK